MEKERQRQAPIYRDQKTYTDKKGESSCELVKTDSEKGKKRKRRMADGRKILVEINGL